MNPDYLFLRRCQQMEKLVDRPKDEVDMLDIARLLRQLLFDKHSLVDTVNIARMKVTFTTFKDDYEARHAPVFPADGGPPTRLMPPTFETAVGKIDAIGANIPENDRVNLTTSQFGKHPVARISGDAVTVKMLVKLAANIEGGVHFDMRPTDAELKVFGTFGRDQAHDEGIISLYSALIIPIGRTVLRGLRPLLDNVKSRVPVRGPAISFSYIQGPSSIDRGN